MIDAEVIRLRRLRRTALLTRKLATTLESGSSCDIVSSRSALTAWSVARLINGRLGAHPNLSYQRGPGVMQTVVDQVLATVTGWVAVKQGRQRIVLAQQLQIFSRRLDDTRALTWSAELSDALNRAQWQLLRLKQELGIEESRTELTSSTPAIPTDWPYIAI